MDMHPDIFGLAFNDYLKGNSDGIITVEMEISEPEELPVSYFFRNFQQMPEWEQKALDACSGRILDVGAGAGSHSLYLQGKGLDVTAIDLSPGAVACMIERGVEQVSAANFFQFEEGRFDTILFLMNGAGMAEKMDKLPELLKKAGSMLTPRGSIFIESTDLLYMFEEEDGSVMIDLAGAYYGEITYQLSYEKVKGIPFPWLFVDYENLADAASDVGLSCELFYRGDNDNYIACLRKNTNGAS